MFEQLRILGSSFDADGVSRLRAQRDRLVARAHKAHEETSSKVYEFLQNQNVQMRVKDELDTNDVDWADIVVSIGGDGTVCIMTNN